MDLRFAALVSLGVAVGHAVIIREAKKEGLDVGRAHRMVFSTVITGFVVGTLATTLYYPELVTPVLRIPWRPLGLSSFGGLVGAIAGGFGYFSAARLSKATAWRYWNLVGYAFPFGWTFGRLGCSIVHDHPGLRAAGLWTWAFPDGQRYDLGRIELVVFVLPIVAWFLWLRKRRGSAPNYPALFLLLYGPFRLLLDRLHENPPRYAGITVDQYGAAAAMALGLWMYRYAKLNQVRAAPSPLR